MIHIALPSLSDLKEYARLAVEVQNHNAAITGKEPLDEEEIIETALNLAKINWCSLLTGEIDRLKKRLEWDEHGYDGIDCRDATIKAQDDRIAKLLGQIELLENIARGDDRW